MTPRPGDEYGFDLNRAKTAIRDAVTQYGKTYEEAKILLREAATGSRMPRPRPGDVINTTGHAPFGFSWHRFSRWAVNQGIKGYQRWLRGYPHPAWTRTHSRLYIRDARILSVTDPYCKWETWDEVQDMYPADSIQIMRPTFYDYSTCGVGHLLDAALQLIGRKYDRGQLVDIMLNRLLGIPMGEFTRVFDAGTARTVCSAGVAACYEHHRLQTGEQWPRLFGGMYIERVPPAAFEALPRGADWAMEFEEVRG